MLTTSLTGRGWIGTRTCPSLQLTLRDLATLADTITNWYYVPERVSATAFTFNRGAETESIYLKAGDIFIWDTESGALLHHIRAQAHGGDLTCIAWNHAVTEPFMFATGSHDGTVRIWTKPPNTPDVMSDDLIDDRFHYHEDTFFAYGKMSRSSSPHEDLGILGSRSESPDLDYDYAGRVRSPRGISFVSSHSSDSSMLKMR